MPRETHRCARTGQQTHLFVGEVTDVDGYHDEIERCRQLSRACAEDVVEGLEGLAGVGRERPLRAERCERPHGEIGTASRELRDGGAQAQLCAEHICAERAPYADRAGTGRAHDAPFGASSAG